MFKFDGTKMCYVRPITTNVNSVWAFKSLLEIAKEVGLLNSFSILNTKGDI